MAPVAVQGMAFRFEFDVAGSAVPENVRVGQLQSAGEDFVSMNWAEHDIVGRHVQATGSGVAILVSLAVFDELASPVEGMALRTLIRQAHKQAGATELLATMSIAFKPEDTSRIMNMMAGTFVPS